MVTHVSRRLPRRQLPATMPANIRRNRFPRRPPLDMPASMPSTILRLPDVAQVPWKVRWLSDWLLFDKLEATFLLSERALHPAGLLAFYYLLLVIFVALWLCGYWRELH